MKRAFGTVALVVTGALTGWLLGRVANAASDAVPRPGPSGRIVTAHGGPLTEFAIQFHRDTGGEEFLPVYEDIFEALTDDTSVWVVVADAEDERIFEETRSRWTGWASGGPKVRYVYVGQRITNWARDRMAVLASDDGDPILVAPRTAHAGARARANDRQVPWALRRALGADGRIVTAPFAFDGGDLIADDRRVYVATPLAERNRERPWSAVLSEVEALLGRPALALGDARDPAPDHHIGMFITPLGEDRVAYADPELGSEILFGSARADGPRRLSAGGRGYEVDESAETRRRFARVGEDLRRAGLHTVALPVVPTTTPFVWLSYDNVLIDQRSDGMHVLMPVYGVPALDAAATDTFRELGATVHPIDVSALFHHGGTVRCLAAVVRRDAP